MSKIEVELPLDLEEWLRVRADQFGFTPAQMLEHLVALGCAVRTLLGGTFARVI